MGIKWTNTSLLARPLSPILAMLQTFWVFLLLLLPFYPHPCWQKNSLYHLRKANKFVWGGKKNLLNNVMNSDGRRARRTQQETEINLNNKDWTFVAKTTTTTTTHQHQQIKQFTLHILMKTLLFRIMCVRIVSMLAGMLFVCCTIAKGGILRVSL